MSAGNDGPEFFSHSFPNRPVELFELHHTIIVIRYAIVKGNILIDDLKSVISRYHAIKLTISYRIVLPVRRYF